MIKPSPYPFDNLEPKAQLRARPIDIEQKSIPAEQYNYFYYAESEDDGYDGYDIIWNDITPLIDICFVSFSEIEGELEHHLYSLISERADQLGMIVTRSILYEQKLLTYVDLLRMFPDERDDAKQYIKDVDQLKKHLKRAVEVQNIIAHAKWPSLTRDGFIYSSIDPVSASTSEIHLKYYKLDREKLDEYRSYLQAVANMCNYIYETYYDR